MGDCPPYPHQRIPVILDTDIGTDIDDTWALAMALRSPELDLKLVVTEWGHTTYRASIAAKLLSIGGRTDVSIGLGADLREGGDKPQAPWLEAYDLSSYPGPVHGDGVGAMVDCIMHTPEPVTVIGTGPATNVAAALAREPEIAQRARYVGMQGSIRRGYEGSPGVDVEYNVACDPEACRNVFGAGWDVTITPVDACGIVSLDGEEYRAVQDSRDSLVQAVVENYRIWARRYKGRAKLDAETRSSTLFDTVAVYLAFSDELLVMAELGIRVTNDGRTLIDAGAKTINCATAWRDLRAFEGFLVTRMVGGPTQ